jgi:hypothetical protein
MFDAVLKSIRDGIVQFANTCQTHGNGLYHTDRAEETAGEKQARITRAGFWCDLGAILKKSGA